MADETSWAPAFGGSTVGMAGAQGGTITRDETTPRGARLIIEVTGGPVVISCVVDGWMLHHRLFGDEEGAQEAFEEMKPGLAELAATLPPGGPAGLDAAGLREAHQRMLVFTSKFP